ncbi:MAG: DUF805 domain-containing protein [Rhodospirillaceae bacterium]|nr:DUF805 domain-containing protein [Rhodospirillaceae bacterium]
MHDTLETDGTEQGVNLNDAIQSCFRSCASFSGRAPRSAFWSSPAVGARRLHDSDRSGWWQLLILVPFIGWIIVLIWFVLRGTLGGNRFGPDPLA